MFASLLAIVLAAPIERSWLDRLDPAAIPAAERFAWQPPELVGVLGTHRGRHWGAASAAALSPDGKLIASGGSDHRLRLWDARDLAQLASLEGHRDDISRVAFSPDGKLLATACDDSTVGGPLDRTVRLWRVAGRDLTPWLALPEFGSRVVCMAFLDGGKSLGAVAEDGAVRVWDLLAREPRERAGFTIRAEKPEQQALFQVMAANFARDGKSVLAAGGPFESSVSVWDISTGKRRPMWSEDERPVAQWQSADGVVRVVGSDDKTEMVRREGKTHRVIARLPGVKVTPGGLSPDGKTLTGVSGSRVRVWDVGEDGLRERVLDDAPNEFLYAAAFNRAGDKLYAVRSGGTLGGEVFLTWELKGTRPLPTTVVREAIQGRGRVVFGPSGAVAAVDSKPGGGLFDVSTGKALCTLPAAPKSPYHVSIHAQAFSPDEKRLATSVSASRLEGQRIVLEWHTVVWDMSAGKATLFREVTPGGPRATALAFTADGKGLVAGCQDGSVAWWDLTDDPPRLVKTWKPHDREVSAVAVSLDGQEVVSGTTRGEVRRGTPGGLGVVVRTEGDRYGRTDQLAFTPNGKQLLAMFNTGRFVAADATGKLVTDFRPEYAGFASGAFRSFGLAADGRHVAVPTANGLVYILRLRP